MSTHRAQRVPKHFFLPFLDGILSARVTTQVLCPIECFNGIWHPFWAKWTARTAPEAVCQEAIGRFHWFTGCSDAFGGHIRSYRATLLSSYQRGGNASVASSWLSEVTAALIPCR